MLIGLQLYAEFYQGQVDLLTLNDDESVNLVYKNGAESLNPVDQKEWKVINGARAIAYGRLMRGIAPCPGHDPPSEFELDACTSVSDLFWRNDLKEDAERLVPEVGAVVRAGPEFKKGLIVAPDTTTMTTRHDDILSIRN